MKPPTITRSSVRPGTVAGPSTTMPGADPVPAVFGTASEPAPGSVSSETPVVSQDLVEGHQEARGASETIPPVQDTTQAPVAPPEAVQVAEDGLPPMPIAGQDTVTAAYAKLDARFMEILRRCEMIRAENPISQTNTSPEDCLKAFDEAVSRRTDMFRNIVAELLGEWEIPATERIGSAIWERIEKTIDAKIAKAVGDLPKDEIITIVKGALAVHAKLAIDTGAHWETGDRAGLMVRPTVRFVQHRKKLDFMPRPMPGGDIALIHNHDPDRGAPSSEIHLTPTGTHIVDFGYRVEVPEGWLADVTTEGSGGQRIYIATLSGSTPKHASLTLALRSNVAVTIGAGTEIARLHLRRTQPAVVTWRDLRDVSDEEINSDGNIVHSEVAAAS